MTPLDLGNESGGPTLQLLVGPSQGQPEMLLVLDRPNAGVVRVRSWTSDDWSAAPTTAERNAIDLLRDVEGWVRQRRGLNHSLTVVRQWLVGVS